jgi:hypothetical protein
MVEPSFKNKSTEHTFHVFSAGHRVATLSDHQILTKDLTHHFVSLVPALRCRKFEISGNYIMLATPLSIHPGIYKNLEGLWVPTGHSLWISVKRTKI